MWNKLGRLRRGRLLGEDEDDKSFRRLSMPDVSEGRWRLLGEDEDDKSFRRHMSMPDVSEGRRERVMEAESLKSFDSLEVGLHVSQSKKSWDKGRWRLLGEDEDDKSFRRHMSMPDVSKGRRRLLGEDEDDKSFRRHMSMPDVSEGRRRPPEEVEDLKSFDTLEVGPDVQSHFKVPQGKDRESWLEEGGLRLSYREETYYLLRDMMRRFRRIRKADEKKDEKEADDGDSRNVGEEVTEGGKQVSQQLHEVQTEKQQHLVEEEANKIRVYEGTVTSEGTHLDLKLGAVHLTFPPDAVSEPTSVVVHKWKSSVCSPQLQEHEAIVSNVIEISTTNNEASQFNVGVKLVFSHCALDLQGYELVIKRLTKKETNDWEEVEGTVYVRELSDLEDDYPNEVPVSFPVVQADIAEWSIYTVICRLKPSPTYTISSSGGCFNHPDYPGVAVSVPTEAVSVESKFPLQLKVQEIPNDEFEGRNVYVGPILRISCSQGIEFLKPVTIQLPVAPRVEGGTIPDPLIYRVRVLFLRSDVEKKEWVDISDDLENPARFDGTSVTFQVKRFSGYAYIIIPHTAEQVAVDPNVLSYLQYITRTSPITASFFAYFRTSERIRSRDLLHLVCCPAHLRSQVKEELFRDGVSSREVYEISSGRGMIPGHDKAFVFVSGGISPVNEEYMGEVYLMLDASCQHRNQLPIRLISDQEYCLVEFRSFANLHFRLPSRQVQIETSSGFRVKLGNPTDEELQAIAGRIGGKWKALGRQLKILESQLTGFDRDQPDEYEKAYAVLVEWKQRGGSENATYQILKEALCHALVGRRDLAEEFCCLNNSVS